ncbi:MAG: polysaccharide deacetylase family protein, partial [Dysgonamonadaceae bacterium]|nr:polysaccharide deacetylase family protein [Dysgonamonadaceae bacterium]
MYQAKIQPSMVYLFFSSENTSRLRYVAKHIFNRLLQVDFEIITQKEIFQKQSGICINYSNENLNHGLQIVPQGLLNEKGVRSIKNLEQSVWQGLFYFFKQTQGDIPFDLFSASFYLLTSYEEYYPEKLDSHQRFPLEESLLYRNGVLEIPVIDRWANLLKLELEKRGYDVSVFGERQFRTICTFDIDHPYLYRNKGFIKNTGGLIRDVLQSKFSEVMNRIFVQLHQKTDPYFQTILNIEKYFQQGNRSYYLFILTAGNNQYDRSTIYPVRRFYNYIKSLQLPIIGLHPSYYTLLNNKQLIKEKNKLERILQRKITVNRQHFLRMQLPETFRVLQAAGFQEDFTLTFAQASGFRSGTAVPYFFYDLERDKETSLEIHPTIMMDTTLIHHLKLTPDEAFEKIKKLIDACRQSGGDYVSLWHNSNLAGRPEENPWIDVFIRTSEYA